MLVPGGDTSNSYAEKKEFYDSSGGPKKIEDKAKFEGGKFSSPNYEIPVKGGTSSKKKQLDFSQALNLRKQHTSTNV